MSVNQLRIEDIYQIMNVLHTQATGRSAIAPVNTSEFVSMATTTLAAGTDPVYNSLMQLLGRTVFIARPYTRRFDIMMSNEEFGAIKRRISYADSPIPEASDTFDPVDGSAPDQWVIRKMDVLETRFYGSAVYRDWFTTFEDQLTVAFEGPEQLREFISSKMTEISNKWEQYLESLNRSTVANFIGAKVAKNNGVIHLLSEYNALTGLSLTAQTVYQPDNLADFFRWVRARINTLSRQMTERSNLFQVDIAGKTINRHTPYEDQKMFIRADALDIIDTMVNTTTYHNEPLAYADVEGVSYWQDINTPAQIQVTPSSIDANGAVITEDAQTVNNLFGLIVDREAIGANMYLYKIRNTGLNAKSLYYNTWLNARIQYLNDLSMKGIVLMLD